MKPEDITAQLSEKGVRQIDIVRRLGMDLTSRPVVSMVIHRLSRSRRIEQEIGKALGRPLTEVFPEWYGADARKRRQAA
jgi:lambda repressor-like predicted transcriptional regulator